MDLYERCAYNYTYIKYVLLKNTIHTHTHIHCTNIYIQYTLAYITIYTLMANIQFWHFPRKIHKITTDTRYIFHHERRIIPP